ncbi:hypothetical protein RUND412_003204 [Rhizina undulata]
MTSTQDTVSPLLSPPLTQGRPLSSLASPGALPIKSPSHHRHSSLGSTHSTHRITRRKSMSSSSGTNIAAVAQAIKDAVEIPFSLPAAQAGSAILGKSNGKANGLGAAVGLGVTGGTGLQGYPSPPSSLPTTGPLGNVAANGNLTANFAFPKKVGILGSGTSGSSAITEGEASDINRQARNRRASEGAHILLAGPKSNGAQTGEGVGGRSIRGRSGSELKCEKCGKGYKHSSCLTKHLWEHTPEWSYTSKLLISKHQQVQLLEAASILVSMKPTTPPTSSSGASANDGGSSINDSASSSEDTTPPPQYGSEFPASTTARVIRNSVIRPGKRHSFVNCSRSFQPPTVSNSFLAGSAPISTAFPTHFSQRPVPRPRASITSSSPAVRANSITTEDEALAAAVELLSCSFNTHSLTSTLAPGSIPRTGVSGLGSPTIGGRSHLAQLVDVVNMKIEQGDGTADVRMEDLEESVAEDDEEENEWEKRRASEEDEDGVFGRMEE